MVNGSPPARSGKNGGFLPFFEFGTPVAIPLMSTGWSGRRTKIRETQSMTAIEFASNKAFAAVFAFGASALFMAYAILPASPVGLVA